MNELRTALQRGDPMAHEEGLHASDVEQIRRRMLSEPASTTPRVSRVALLAVATLVVGATASVWLHQPSVPVVAPSPTPSSNGSTVVVKQLQFSGPGGTRVIWTFNPNLEVR